MKRLVVLVAAITAFAYTLAVPAAGQVPSLIESQVEGVAGPPLWVSAEGLLTGEVQLDRADLDMSGSLRRFLNEQQSIQSTPGIEADKKGLRLIEKSDCKEFVVASDHLDTSLPAQNLGDLLRNGRSIFSGNVEAVEPGFFRGIPSSLLKVKVTKWLRSSVMEEEVDHIYVYHPEAYFSLGAQQFCGRSLGSQVRPGDRILVFNYSDLSAGQEILVTPREEQVFIETSKGTLILPPSVHHDKNFTQARRLADVEALVRADLDRAVEPR